MQTVGRTRRSVWDQERTPAVHHTRSELEEMLRDRFGRTGTGRLDTSGTAAAPFQTDRRTFSAAESECRSTVSKAADRSSNTNADKSPESMASRMSDRTFNAAVSDEWPKRYAD